MKLIDKYTAHTRINDCFNWLIPLFDIFCCEITLVCKDFARGVENLKKNKLNFRLYWSVQVVWFFGAWHTNNIHRKQNEYQRLLNKPQIRILANIRQFSYILRCHEVSVDWSGHSLCVMLQKIRQLEQIKKAEDSPSHVQNLCKLK